MTIRSIQSEDIVLWPDGIWCYHGELHEYAHKSDDYEILPARSERWLELTTAELDELDRTAW